MFPSKARFSSTPTICILIYFLLCFDSIKCNLFLYFQLEFFSFFSLCKCQVDLTTTLVCCLVSHLVRDCFLPIPSPPPYTTEKQHKVFLVTGIATSWKVLLVIFSLPTDTSSVLPTLLT